MSRFGSPVHDTSQITRESKPVFRNYARSKCVQKQVSDLETDECSMINLSKSESESEITNELSSEKQNDSIQLFSIQQSLRSEKILETLWKLYRNVGESIEDLKGRLINNSLFDNVTTDFEFAPENNDNFDCESKLTSIKREILSDNEHSLGETESIKEEKNVKANEIKQNVSMESTLTKKIKEDKTELANCNFIFDDSFNPNDILMVKIHESDRAIQFGYNHDVNDIKKECVDPMLKVPITRDHESFDSTSNCKYTIPHLKQITNAELVASSEFTVSNHKDAKSRRIEAHVKDENSSDDESPMCKTYPKLSRTVTKVKRETLISNDYDEPIITETYDIRTMRGGRRTLEVKIPTCLRVSRLSDSSNDEEIEMFDRKVDEGVIKVRSTIQVRRKRKHYNTLASPRDENEIRIKREWNKCDAMPDGLAIDLSRYSNNGATIYDNYLKGQKLSVEDLNEQIILDDNPRFYL